MGRPRGSKNKGGAGPMEGPGPNGDDVPLRVNTVSGAELRALIERVEDMNFQIADLQSGKREIFQEIKGAGYDAATVRAIVKLRAMDPDKRATMDDLMEQYTSALGDFASTPLGEAGAERVREDSLAE